jgi:glycosyltransferase involved in cell wall biosynthesis
VTEGGARPDRRPVPKATSRKAATRKKKPAAGKPVPPVGRSANPEPVAATPMRIVVRVHGWPPRHNAGSELMVHTMLRALAARGHECTVWLSRYSADRRPYDLDGVRVIPFAARMDFASAAKNADVIVSYWENVPAAGALARGFGRPFVVVCHNAAQTILRNVAVSSPALAVYNSEHVRAEAEAFFAEYRQGQRPARSMVVRPPVAPGDYRTTPGDRVTLINLSADKGGVLFWRLAERFPGREFLAVRGAYGEQIVKDLPNVEVIGHLPADRMRDEVYARTRVLLMPSAQESWGRTAVEAMVSGIPVVAASAPGLSESLGEAGIFAERGDVDAWANVLERLDDPAEWAAASERALARAKELDPAADLAAWCEAIESLKR